MKKKPEKNEENPRFVLIEPTDAGMTCGVYGLSGIEALGLLRCALMWCENKLKDQISVVATDPLTTKREA